MTLSQAFLLGAGQYAYLAAPFLRGVPEAPGDSGWSEPAWDGVRPEYVKKLGDPLGPATLVNGTLQVRVRVRVRDVIPTI